MRKIACTLVAIFSLVICGSDQALAGKKIGRLLFSKEGRYLETQNSVLAQLKKAGYTEPDTVYYIENAEGNKTKASEIAKKFAGMNLDLVMTFGTSATNRVRLESRKVRAGAGV